MVVITIIAIVGNYYLRQGFMLSAHVISLNAYRKDYSCPHVTEDGTVIRGMKSFAHTCSMRQWQSLDLNLGWTDPGVP